MRGSWFLFAAIFVVCGCGGGGGGGSAAPPAPVTPVPSASPSSVPGSVARYVHVVSIALAQPYPALGSAATIPVTVSAKDANGTPIVAPDTYANPITLIDQDQSGHTSFSRTTVNAPSDAVTLHYDGGYFPTTGLTATWSDPTGFSVQPFRQMATGLPTVETSVGAGRIVTSLTVGGDGALWFGERRSESIGRMAASGGAPTYYPMSGGWGPVTLAAGPDGAVWFTAFGFESVVTPAVGIGRISPGGTYGPMWTTSSPYQREFVAASDGNMYLNQLAGFTRITPAGAISTIPISYGGNTLHTDTMAAGPDGALWTTSLGMMFRLDLSSGAVTSAAYPTPPGAGRPIEPGILIALNDRRLYFDDKGGALYTSSPPAMTPSFLASGTNVPHQGSPLDANSMALARDGTLWFASSSMTLDGHPTFGHVVGNAVQLLVGEAGVAAKNANQQDVPATSLVITGDGRMWYARSDVLGSFTP